MNTKYFIAAAALAMTTAANAQGYTDAVRFNMSDYQGTSRSQAMGSAFGALGADLTSQSINPAGLAVYRATEAAIGLGINSNSTETNYYDFKREDDKISVPFSNIGVVFNFGQNTTGITNHALSISYSRLANYNKSATYEDQCGYNSMLDYFCSDDQATAPFTGDLAYRAGWIVDPSDTIGFCTNVWEWPYKYDKLDPDARRDENGNGAVDHYQNVRERGAKGESSLTYAFALNNQLLIGAGMGFVSIDYKEVVEHTETYYGKANGKAYASYTYGTELKQDGAGVNFKLGLIYKPMSQLRLGFALHSVTFCSIEESYNSWIDGAYRDQMFWSDDSHARYRYRIPGKFIASIATVGKIGLFSFDYERSNYSRSKYKDADGDNSNTYDAMTQDTKNALQKVNTFRFGAEGRVASNIYLRAGYKFQTSPYKDGISVHTIQHDAISGGAGFRSSNFFVDFACVCNRDKGDRWVLPDADYSYEDNAPASYTSKAIDYTLTFGFRF